MTPNHIITILARSGSKGIPNKALTTLHGRTLLEWTLLHATQYAHCHIIVSSDSRSILTYAEGLFPEANVVTIHRPQRFATDDCPKMTAINWVVGRYLGNRSVDAIVDLDVCNPMRRWSDISGALAVFERNFSPDSVVSATPARRSPYFNILGESQPTHQDMYVKIPMPTINVTGRQMAPQSWDINCCVYVYGPRFLADYTHPVGRRTLVYPMPPHTFCDIDHPLDLMIVEHLMKEYGYV